jgi:antitoxin component of MazEF toxin-antitoxin module
MAITLKRKVVRTGNSLRVTVPKETCDILKLNEGDELEFSSSDGNVLVRKAERG